MSEIPSYYDRDDPLLSPRVVAKRLQKHPETVYRWIRGGVLPCVRLGPRRKYIRESAVLQLLASRSTAA